MAWVTGLMEIRPVDRRSVCWVSEGDAGVAGGRLTTGL